MHSMKKKSSKGIYNDMDIEQLHENNVKDVME